MFKNFRIQIIQPCRASCKWCGTYKKNRHFQELIDNGTAQAVHNFYQKAVLHFHPELLYISGGEPLLMPQIGKYMAQLAKGVTKNIFLFSSFQFPGKERENIELEGMPWDKVILTHTTAGFNEENWLDMTRGFPFKLYIENMRELCRLKWQKHIKFILNHDYLGKELEQFLEHIKPNKSFNLSLKLMNNQDGDFGAHEIDKTKEAILSLLENGIANLPEGIELETKLTGEEAIRGFLKGDQGASCPYRNNPLEMRFAFYKGDAEGVKFKYRFCPHFPPNKHFIFKTGRDSLDDINLNFENKKWHNWCSQCRLKLYMPEQKEMEA